MTLTGLFKAALFLAAAAALTACGSGNNRSSDRGGLMVFGGQAEQNSSAQIGVNAYLWRASLDTLNFMPLESADPYGGIIITGWHSDPAAPGERFKATVYILDTRLRADALNVSIFRQTNLNGAWTDATVDPETELQIENAILTRARQLRLSTGAAR